MSKLFLIACLALCSFAVNSESQTFLQAEAEAGPVMEEAWAETQEYHPVTSTKNGKEILTISTMSYDDIVAFSDGIWRQVEAGEINPRQANKMFEDETGVNVIDFMKQGGEVTFQV